MLISKCSIVLVTVVLPQPAVKNRQDCMKLSVFAIEIRRILKRKSIVNVSIPILRSAILRQPEGSHFECVEARFRAMNSFMEASEEKLSGKGDRRGTNPSLRAKKPPSILAARSNGFMFVSTEAADFPTQPRKNTQGEEAAPSIRVSRHSLIRCCATYEMLSQAYLHLSCLTTDC